MIQASLLEWNRVIILDSALVLSPPVLISPASIVPIATSVAPVLISPASLAAASLAASLVSRGSARYFFEDFCVYAILPYLLTVFAEDVLVWLSRYHHNVTLPDVS